MEYWDSIGNVDLQDGLTISVNIRFNSHQRSGSAVLGTGWMIPLLESRVTALNENSVEVIMPDGWNFFFYRKGNSEIWAGNADWIGETKGAEFTIISPCGWKIRYYEGKIQEICSNKNQTLTYKYNGAFPVEIASGGKVILKIENYNNSDSGKVIIIGSQKINVTLGQRPIVTKKANQNLIIGFDSTLNQLKWSDGKTETFKFDVDGRVNPSMDGSSLECHFVWDPNTDTIIRGKEWKYTVEPRPDDYAVISRTNASGQKELWQFDNATGQEITEDIAGIRLVKTSFVSGPLRGKNRFITMQQNKRMIQEIKFSYDQSGSLIRTLNIGSDGKQITNILPATAKLNDKVTFSNENGCFTVKIANETKQGVTYAFDPKTQLLTIP